MSDPKPVTARDVKRLYGKGIPGNAFTGTYNSRFAEGRIALPSEFCDIIERQDQGEPLIVFPWRSRGGRSYLTCFPQSRYNPTEVDDFDRIFAYLSILDGSPDLSTILDEAFPLSTATVDQSTQSIYVHEQLARATGIEERVVLAGAANRFEIWEPSKFEIEDKEGGEWMRMGAPQR